MQPNDGQKTVSYWVGWAVLAAAISNFAIAFVAFRFLGSPQRQVDSLSQFLLLLSIPACILLLVTSLGLLFHRMFGYYALYLAVGLMGFAGFRISLIPFADKVFTSPVMSDFLLVLSLILVGAVAWEHYNRTMGAEVARPRLHRAIMVPLLFFTVAGALFSRATVQYLRGEAANAASIPVVGDTLKSLQTGPVNFYGVNTLLRGGVTIVISGKIAPGVFQSFTNSFRLREMPGEARAKALPQSARWNLPRLQFPRNYEAGDTWVMGRIETNNYRGVLQMLYRTNDNQFTMELMATRQKAATPGLP